MIAILYFIIALLFSFISSRYSFGGDSAEFSAIAHTWSVGHPPGYPLYSLLLNCITHLIPFGTIPWRASLLSTIPAVLTAYFIFKILTTLKVRTSISLLSSFLYLVLFPVWEYALVPEVFALNSLFVILITYFLLCYRSQKKDLYLYLSALFIGFCVAHHHVFVIFLPGWFWLIKDILKIIVKAKKRIYSLIFLFIIGVSFYLYVPIAGFFNPPIQWEDGKTLLGFWRLITRALYGGFTAYRGAGGNISNQLYDVLSLFILFFQDFRVIGLICVGVGLWFTFKNTNRFFQFLAITSLIHIFFLFYTNFILNSSFSLAMYERFLITFYAILILYFAIGFEYIFKEAEQLIKKYTRKKTLLKAASLSLVLFLCIYIGTVARTNYRALSYIKNGQDFDRLGKDIINTVPNGGIYFAQDDNANFATIYKLSSIQYKARSIFLSVNLIQQHFYQDTFKRENKSLLYPPSLDTDKDFEKFVNLNKKNGIYLQIRPAFGFWVPYGLLWKYYETKEEGMKDLPNIVKANEYLWNYIYHIPELNKDTRNILHLQTIQDFYVDAYISYSKLLVVVREPQKAQEVLKNIIEKYRPSNLSAKVVLMNLLLDDRKCEASYNAAKEIINAPANSIQPEFIPSIVEYYTLCNPSNTKLLELKKVTDTLGNKSKTPLSSF